MHALSDYYRCPSLEYDERLPVPPELLAGLDGERLSISQWFPVGKSGDTVTVAVNNPHDTVVLEEIKRYLKTETCEIRVALSEDIQWFIQDFLHAKPGQLVGTERTGLAFWRNTMAQWRTRLACYRNDMAKVRTDLAFFRLGLGFVAVSNALMRTRPLHGHNIALADHGCGLSDGFLWPGHVSQNTEIPYPAAGAPYPC